MPFCYSPWTNLDISPQGVLSPCCKFQVALYEEKFNIQTHSLLDYVHSDLLSQVREQLKSGQWPAGCERCKIDEDNGIQSKRQLDAQRWHSHYSKIDPDRSEFITASVAFGNTCNLKCITCNSSTSSKWHQEYAEVYGVEYKPVHFYRRDFVDTLISQVPNLVHLDIPGGEPLLAGIAEQKKLLQHYIDSNKASSITLHYTTNATNFPDESWIELWSHFQEVDIQLSIDGIGNRYQYIRYPADWNVLVCNVQQYLELERQQHNIRLSVSHTVSAYNILYIPEFVGWCADVGLPEPWLGRVHYPNHMRPEVWSGKAREFIQSTLLQDTHAISRTWSQVLDQNGNGYFDDFVRYTKIHDANRSLDFVATFPELASFI